jgi:hypothetical protein
MVKVFSSKKAQIIFSCQKKSFLFYKNIGKIPFTGIFPVAINQVHGYGSAARFLPRSGSAKKKKKYADP